MRNLWLYLALTAATIPATAWATDTAPCGAGLVCASNPKSIVDAVNAAGYKALLATDSVGDPKITSAANGYNYAIFFYDCEKGKSCAAIQFQISFEDDGKNTLAMVNKWNRSKRFAQMSLEADNSLRVSYDVTTVGGLNQKNFADAVDWWSVMLGEMKSFFKEQEA